MKREDLKALNLEDATIDAIMALNGKAIESHKAAAQSAQSELETVKGQLTEANTVIESFKAMKPDELKAAADDWKAKYEQAEKDYQDKLATMQFDTELDTALAGAKVKNSKAAKALLNIDDLKDANGKFIAERFTEQIGKIKSDAEYLFESDESVPKIVTGGNNPKTTVPDALEAAMYKGAGIKPPRE